MTKQEKNREEAEEIPAWDNRERSGLAQEADERMRILGTIYRSQNDAR